MTLSPNIDEAIGFLKGFASSGGWLLTAIARDRTSIVTERFGPESEAACREWISRHNQAANVYFHINETAPDFRLRASKDDITAVRYLHVDIDARPGFELDEELSRIRSLLGEGRPNDVPEPSSVVASGGGFWGFWGLEKSVLMGASSDRDQVELRNRRLAELLGGDNTHDIARIARLPGRRVGEVLCPFVALLDSIPVGPQLVSDDTLPSEALVQDVPSWGLDLYSREGKAGLKRFLGSDAKSARMCRAFFAPAQRLSMLGHAIFRVEGGQTRKRLHWGVGDDLRGSMDQRSFVGVVDGTEFLEAVRSDIQLINTARREAMEDYHG